MDQAAAVYLKKREERRVLAGHCWVYSNEIDAQRSPLKAIEPGAVMTVFDARERALGTALMNPASLICGRLFSRRPHAVFDRELLQERLGQALRYRQQLYGAPFYRWCFGESDGLPGLVVDRFDDVLSVQVNTLAMEQRLDDVVAALRTHLPAARVYLKNTVSTRTLEGLDVYEKTYDGEPIEQIRVDADGCTFVLPVAGAQKTGWYYDHRDTRSRVLPWCQGKRVLDLFSFAGAWSVPAARVADAVVAVDASGPALDALMTNAAANGVERVLRTETADVFEWLKSHDQTYDLVICDPPALIKRKKDVKAGTEAYQRLARLAVSRVAPGGMLVFASCSHHFARSELHSAFRRAVNGERRHARLVLDTGQAMDHPVHPAMPETEYLKTLVAFID